MANLRTRWWLGAVATFFLTSSAVLGQEFQPFGPTGVEADLEWFAPAELGDFGEPPDPNEGYFFSYERLHWNVTNAPSNDHPFDGEWTWGNRFEAGWMSEEDCGWYFNFFHVDGPTYTDHPQGFNEVTNFWNDAGGAEAMRTWRLNQRHRGSYIEPMLGVRFLWVNQEVSLIDTDANLRYFNEVENNIFGPQVGLRWFRQRERWTLAAEGRFFAGFNHQLYLFEDENTFVPTGEIRFQATYELFRHAAITFGYTGLFLTDGVGQEAVFTSEANTSYHVFMNGINFGFTLNR